MSKKEEQIGLLEALSWPRNQVYPNVLFEMDAKIVYLAVNDTRTDSNEFGRIME